MSQTQREKERQRALDKIENDLDDGRIGPRSGDSPDELPVIIDRGPYRGHIYPREQLFFNSIMLASDVEPIYAGPPGGELRQEVHRTPIRRPKTQAEQKLPPRPVPSEYLTASQNRENLRRWEEKNNKSAAAGQTQHPRPVPSEYLTSAQNTENLRRWEERNGRTPTVQRAQVSERRPSPPGQPSPPRAPITPGTIEWDGFMDFPSGNHQSGNPGVQVTVNEPNASHSLPTTTTPAARLHPTVLPQTTVNAVLRTDPLSPPAPADSVHTQAQAELSTELPNGLPDQTEQPELLTWLTALNRIIRNDLVDPATRTRIQERVRQNSATVDSRNGDAHPITMADAGLVPNFSYPIAGSAFYDRIHAEETPPSQSLEDVRGSEEQQQPLTNGVSSGHHSDSSSSHTLYRSPTPDNWPLRGGSGESPALLTNGVHPGYYPPSSSSGDSSNAALHYPPALPDNVPEHVFNLLCSLLTPSELALHYDVVQDSAPPHLPPFPALVPPSNAASDIPIVVRLVQRLHAAVYGLQDRVWGLEEDLIPQLSTQLEENHLQIKELDQENGSLQDEITELKRIADFSTKVLTGCWEREWEVWRTHLDIQKRREAYRSPLACIFSRTPTLSAQDDGLLDFCKPEGYVALPLPTGKVTQGSLKKKELDALLLMAKQNVTILIEDLGELKALAEAYDRRNEAQQEVRPVEGSRRDI
ncbi:hypothetical protein J4E80_008343 [Alternaria sp. BMP 0032]|nr:hypothetical protein J4E80_008343 [Alternaria sp. BMP 0032]